jgi:hypothetical protein
VLLAGVLLVVLAMVLATWSVRRNWRGNPDSVRTQQLREVFTHPRLAVSTLAHRRSRLLDSNPAAWLQSSTLGARLARWGWVLLLAPLAMSGLGAGAASWSLASIIMVIGIGFAAVGSFRRELESGALELLLVTPLTPRQLVMGRLRGLFVQFLPAFVALLLVGQAALMLPGSHASVTGADLLIDQASLAVMMGVMAVVGIAFSLSGLPFAPSLVMAYLLVLVLPQALGNVAGQFLGLGAGVSFKVRLLYWIGQVVNVRLAWGFAHRQLADRRFAMRREAELQDGATIATAS